jgi:hypothetical protein
MEGADELRLRGSGGGRCVTARSDLNECGEEAEGPRNPTLVVPQDGIVTGVGSVSGPRFLRLVVGVAVVSPAEAARRSRAASRLEGGSRARVAEGGSKTHLSARSLREGAGDGIREGNKGNEHIQIIL